MVDRLWLRISKVTAWEGIIVRCFGLIDGGVSTVMILNCKLVAGIDALGSSASITDLP